MKSNWTAWVKSLKTGDDGRGGGIYGSCQKHESLSVHKLLFITRHLFRDSFMTTLKSNFCTALTAQNTTQNNCIFLHSSNTTELQSNVFLTWIHQLLVASNGRWAYLNANNSQGKVKIPQSISALLFLFSANHFKGLQTPTDNVYLISLSVSGLPHYRISLIMPSINTSCFRRKATRRKQGGF